jgi:hypothetical protein
MALLPSVAVINISRLARTGLEPDILHAKSLRLAMSYRSNYGLEFPELKHIPIRAQYIKELGLPSKCLVDLSFGSCILITDFVLTYVQAISHQL